MESLALGVELYDNVVQDCAEIIEWLEHDPTQWNDAEVDRGYGSAQRTDTSLRDSDVRFVPVHSFGNPPCLYEMNKAVWSLMNDYAVRYEFGFRDIEPINVNRYMEGQRFVEHQDYIPGGNRVLSALVYLNDVGMGGETVFPFAGVTVEPKEGRVVLFPSNYPYRHAAMPPRMGIKYTAAYWALG